MREYQGNCPIILSEAFQQTMEVPFVFVTRCNLFAKDKTKGFLHFSSLAISRRQINQSEILNEAVLW